MGVSVSVRRNVRRVAETVLQAMPRRTHAGDRLILAYHNVVPDDAAVAGDRSLHLAASAFARHLAVMRQEADVVSLPELLTSPATRARLVSITFDDAYASALRLGVARCVAEQLPCTVFVAPALLGTIPPWDALAARGAWTDSDRQQFLWVHRGRPPLVVDAVSADAGPHGARIATHAELEASAREHVAFGNHTMTHPNLAALDTAEVHAEIAAADAWLRREHPARRVPMIAYPFGLAPSDPRAAVPADCADFGLLVGGGWMISAHARSPLAIPRWNVPAGISDAGFAARLRGWLTDR